MKILIAGASGAIGRLLVHRLRANQHEVFALSRSHGSALLMEIGAEPVIADAFKCEHAESHVLSETSENVLHRCAPSKFFTDTAMNAGYKRARTR